MDEVLAAIGYCPGSDLPFTYSAGMVGYLGYELKALHGVANRHVSTMPDAVLFLPKNYVIYDHQESRAWACNSWGEDSTYLADDAGAMPISDEVKFVPGPAPIEMLALDDEREVYLEKINQCLEQIRCGESYEICLTNRARVPHDGSALDAFLKMRAASPVPYASYLRMGDISVLSASPEKYLSVDNQGRVQSKPIKGTRPRSRDERLDQELKSELSNSAKDRAENLMIVDLVRHDLNGICVPGTVCVPTAFNIESYSSVHQLVSTVEGRIRSGVGSFQAIKACFPPGSMTGAPKIRTMDIIDSIENSSRGIYSGAIGWVDFSGKVNLSVAIRTVVIRCGIAEFGVGGAIVADSIPEDEFEETLVKASVPCFALRTSKQDPAS